MVDILMATYNGEEFVAEQIQSIIDQSHIEWQLIVHDDGSTDSTIAIIQEFCQKDRRIKLITDNIKHLGVARNFIHLLNFSQSDYIMFCDQDDIWLPNKVEIMLNAIESKDNGIPQTIFSNAYLWNEQRGIISNKNTLHYSRSLRDLLFLNSGVQGASAIFNTAMRQVLQVPLDYYAMHDHVLTLSAITLGEIDYIDMPLMKYRQHTRNVSGNAPGSMHKKILTLFENRHNTVVFVEHYRGLQCFYKQHKNNINIENQQLIETFLALPSKNAIQRITNIVKYRFNLYGSTWLLVMKVCFRMYM